MPDHEYIERIKGHYKMFREKVDKPGSSAKKRKKY